MHFYAMTRCYTSSFVSGNPERGNLQTTNTTIQVWRSITFCLFHPPRTALQVYKTTCIFIYEYIMQIYASISVCR